MSALKHITKLKWKEGIALPYMCYFDAVFGFLFCPVSILGCAFMERSAETIIGDDDGVDERLFKAIRVPVCLLNYRYRYQHPV